MQWLTGKRTYLIAILGGVTWVLALLNIISSEQATQIYTLLGIGAVTTIRAAIK